MSFTRRDFIRTSGALGAGLALGPTSIANTRATNFAEKSIPTHDFERPSPKKVLILGGTGFIGPNMVRYAVERGHEVTIFTRGRAKAEIPDVEHLIGDRNDNLTALKGRKWDIVFDNNTSRDYKWVDLSTEVLKDAVEQYIFVSSISAYAADSEGYASKDSVLWEPAINEDSPRFTPPDDWKHGDNAQYGLMKALSENIAHAAFPGRTTIVRPGLIVGPGDRTDRFTYWPLPTKKEAKSLRRAILIIRTRLSTNVISQSGLSGWPKTASWETSMPRGLNRACRWRKCSTGFVQPRLPP